MSKKLLVVFFLLFALGSMVFTVDSQAMPNFARKYKADCTMCHTQIPKLNRIGYEFRLAGFRLPSEIGKDEKEFNLGDFFAARFQVQYRWDQAKAVSGTRTTDSQLQFFEFTLYPLTGSWGRYFASLGEFSMSSDDVFEVENAYVRGVYGNESGWGQGRIGVMHPFEGFGASDRPLGINRPLFQGTTATGSPFTTWGKDQMGIEAGYYLAKTGTAISANIWNGIKANGDPAQGGGLSKDPGPGHNDKDYQVFITQFIGGDSSVSLYYYRGVVPFPATGTQTRDVFERYAAYANYFVLKQLNLLAGYQYGHDSLKDRSVAGGGNVGNSKGFFLEADFHAIPGKLAAGARYDNFDPSNKTGHDLQYAESVFANYYILHGLQFIPEYRHRENQQTTGGKTKDDLLIARLIFIW